MLVAHLVPGYFTVIHSRKYWESTWNNIQRTLLWIIALGSTITPDIDVIYNIFFRGVFRHQTLWTHSIFIYMVFGGLWVMLRACQRWTYIRTIAGLMAIGGLSHLLFDLISHGTPLFYPLTMIGFEIAPQRVVHGGVLAYLTDPIFLLEPILLSVIIIHWIFSQKLSSSSKKSLLIMTISSVLILMAIFYLCLPILQNMVLPLLPG